MRVSERLAHVTGQCEELDLAALAGAAARREGEDRLRRRGEVQAIHVFRAAPKSQVGDAQRVDAVRRRAKSHHGVPADAHFLHAQATPVHVADFHCGFQRRPEPRGQHVAGDHLAGLHLDGVAIHVALAGDLAVDRHRQGQSLGALRRRIWLALDPLREVADHERPRLRPAEAAGDAP
jgi:hypothetical protein